MTEPSEALTELAFWALDRGIESVRGGGQPTLFCWLFPPGCSGIALDH